eukprot:scaffold17558_cov131-Isochrysis_galbana.AAC.1
MALQRGVSNRTNDGEAAGRGWAQGAGRRRTFRQAAGLREKPCMARPSLRPLSILNRASAVLFWRSQKAQGSVRPSFLKGCLTALQKRTAGGSRPSNGGHSEKRKEAISAIMIIMIFEGIQLASLCLR